MPNNHGDHDALAYDDATLAHQCQVCGQPMPFNPEGRAAVIEGPGGFPLEGTIVRAFDDEGIPSYRVLVTDGPDDDTTVYSLPTSEVGIYLATYGDWVRLADGRAATVTRSQPAYNTRAQRGGTYYDLMFKGGHEQTFYHWEGDSFLTLATLMSSTTDAKTMPLFTVVSQEA